MAKVKIKINYKENDGSKFKQILSFINPECDDKTLKNFVTELSNLTSNEVEDIFKVVEKFLSESGGDYISVDELQDIIDGKYTPSADDDPITMSELQDVIDGKYTPVADDDALTADDFVF